MPPNPWPLSRLLLDRILEDRISDRFVAERIWEHPQDSGAGLRLGDGGR